MDFEINVKMEGNKRTTNFSTKEIKFLIQLVDKKKDTIECKKTDRTSSEDKINAWLEIEAEFNSAFDNFRSFKNLKTKYENLKKTAKKNYAQDKQVYRTGGGRKPPSQVSAFDENILKIVQEEQMVGHESIYDDDFVSPPNLEMMEIAKEYLLEDSIECLIEEKEKPKETPKWVKYSPTLLKSKKHEAFYTGEKRNTKDIWAEVGELKKKKLNIEINVIEEEWKLKKTKYELEISQLKKINKTKKTVRYTKGKSYKKRVEK